MRSAALCTAQAGESPLVLLSGHAALKEIGRGGFQELRQADMAAPVTKASWAARSAATLGAELARGHAHRAVGPAGAGASEPAVRSAGGDGRRMRPPLWPGAAASRPTASRSMRAGQRRVLAALAQAARPLMLAGPQLCHAGDLAAARAASRMRSAFRSCRWRARAASTIRALGAFAEVLRAGRPDRAAGQGARFHAALRRSAVCRCRPAGSS